MHANRVCIVVAVGLLATRIAAQGAASQPVMAVLTGEVVSVVQGETSPVVRAIVRLEHVESRARHSAVTDSGGRFAIGDVPAGRYLLSASSPAYVTTYYGAQRFNQVGATVVVAEGQRLEGLRIALIRGGVVAGSVRTGSGRPASGVSVVLHRGGSTPGQWLPTVVGTDSRATNISTDAGGGFRFYGLPPGRYTVSAGGLSTGGAAGLARTYFPGTLLPTEATFVDLESGEERTGVDITLRRTAGQRVSGQILGPGAEGAQLRVEPSAPFRVLAAGADGRFVIENVPPGSYMIRARAVVAGPAGVERFGGEEPVIVGEVPVNGVLLNMSAPFETHVAGRVLVETGSSGVPPRMAVRLRPRDAWSVTHPLAGAVGPDRRFLIAGVPPDDYIVELAFDESDAASATWRPVSFLANSVDALDAGLIVNAAGISDAVVTVTQATQRLRGTLRGSDALPPTMLTMLVFPEDRRFWTPGSRRIRAARPATDGTFRFDDLPAGEYRAIALHDPDPVSLFDPAYLASLVEVSMRISIASGEQKTLDVQVAAP